MTSEEPGMTDAGVPSTPQSQPPQERRTVFILVGIGILLLIAFILSRYVFVPPQTQQTSQNATRSIQEDEPVPEEIALEEIHPLSIESLRNGSYPGSAFVIEETLAPGSNYQRYRVSYQSDGLKQFGLLTIPNGDMPEGGWPAIIFNHGYIPPDQYVTTELYIAYTDAFSRNGYVLFRPDYRGHDRSEGEATGGYGTNDYTVDVLNALASVKKHPQVNPEKIGMWGHSMGGHITLRSMVVREDIKAGVIWAGVVASYPDLLSNWRRRAAFPTPSDTRRRWRDLLVNEYGTPEENPGFWNSISATTYLSDISGPLQLHHGTADSSVPLEFSEKLSDQLKQEGKSVELFTYEGDDHNLANNLGVALNRSVAFFDQYLK